MEAGWEFEGHFLAIDISCGAWEGFSHKCGAQENFFYGSDDETVEEISNLYCLFEFYAIALSAKQFVLIVHIQVGLIPTI